MEMLIVNNCNLRLHKMPPTANCKTSPIQLRYVVVDAVVNCGVKDAHTLAKFIPTTFK